MAQKSMKSSPTGSKTCKIKSCFKVRTWSTVWVTSAQAEKKKLKFSSQWTARSRVSLTTSRSIMYSSSMGHLQSQRMLVIGLWESRLSTTKTAPSISQQQSPLMQQTWIRLVSSLLQRGSSKSISVGSILRSWKILQIRAKTTQIKNQLVVVSRQRMRMTIRELKR